MNTEEWMGFILLAAAIVAVTFSQHLTARGHDRGTLHRRDARGLLLGRTRYLTEDAAWEAGNAAARPLMTWIIRLGIAGLALAVAALFFWPGLARWLAAGTLTLQVALWVINTVRLVRASGGMVDSLGR
ncbi:hypothetical protein [Corynebacterium guangdongense]|uniref:SdpI family protein n=1 Tax=Corynebacterium guangdongense TaxID=1783348 RepID=A0ABU2A0K6_9CORY|nr:hypothetical protein [Corynebacterium guangdongense]MDR7330720.1 hypothetical protein [Corynebacterium guangdongense]WJZ16735.1 hypothetical protein CGUA_00630 [Corynebacterium guangdongense]